MSQFPTDVFVSEPMAAYKAKRAEYLTSHQLSEYRACPLLYHKSMAGLIAAFFFEAFLVGAATHTLALEGRAAFEREYVVGGPINPKTEKPYGSDTQKFREWAKTTGKTALSDDQFALACRLASAVRLHPLASELLKNGSAEGVLRVPDYCGVKAQIRVDWFNPFAGIVDLKTCENIDQFAKGVETVNDADSDAPIIVRLSPDSDAAKYHYHEQMAFYRGVYRQKTGVNVPAYLIAVEKRDPNRVGVFRLSDELLFAKETDNQSAISDLIVSRRENVWPTNYEELRVIAL